MTILGVDCGTERTGYGVISTDGRRHSLISTGVIRNKSTLPLSERLAAIAGELRKLIAAHMPEAVAVEDIFYSLNVKSAFKLAHVRGVVLLVAAESGLPVGEYSPLEVKMSVVGFGRAEKHQVQLMVRSILKSEVELETFDASDALAVALCHAMRAGTPSALEVSG
jgi:crossover junction endodeoxyribonuclease RuvC